MNQRRRLRGTSLAHRTCASKKTTTTDRVNAKRCEMPELEPSDVDARTLAVLLIDDDESVLAVTRLLLAGKVAAVDTAASGAEALRKLAVKDYDVIVSDVHMDGVGGEDVLRWLTEHRPGAEARLLFVSGNLADDACLEFVRAAQARCLEKPYTVATLLAAIRETAAMGRVLCAT